MSPKLRNWLAGSLSVLALAACSPDAPKTPEAPKGKVAATVNGIAISEGVVNLMAAQHAAQGQPDNPELRQGIIDQLAMQVLIADEAVKKGLDKSPGVADEIELTRQSILARAFVQDFLTNGKISDEALAAEYERVKGELAGNEVKARHILVEKESEAKSLIAKLKANPKSFATLAKQSSRDPGSSANGGDLGWFDPRGMVSEFALALAKLEKGKFTEEPVKTQYGYHVILLEDARPKEVPPLDQLKPALRQQMLQQNLRKLFEETKAKAKIEVVPVAPAAAGGKPAEAGK